MKYEIKHEIRGRLRVHFKQNKMTYEEADRLHYYLQKHPGILNAKVYERTADAVILFDGSRDEVAEYLNDFSTKL